MKKLLIYIFTIFFLFINTCSSQNVEPVLNAQSQELVLEYVEFSRIDKAVKKYTHLQSQANWIKRLKYFAIGAGCAGLGALIFNHYFMAQSKTENSDPSTNSKEMPSQEDLKIKKDALFIAQLEKEILEKTLAGRAKKDALSALDIVIFTAVSASLWAIINKGGDLLKNQFMGIDLDANFYKQKNAKLNDLIKQFGMFLVQHEQNTNGEHASKFFDLMFADILINHTTLVRWFEDLIGFIKCMVIANSGRDSIEVACLEKDILSISINLNQFTDKISYVFNSCSNAKEHADLVNQATASYLVFCKQFSKFIYDCGMYLYEEDFLQENSLQN